MQFSEIMALEPHGPDTWVGMGPQYPWGGLYGGQIVAQALAAACRSVEPPFRVHSLHAFFIRLGDHDQPVRYEVDRIRDGRSFLTRRVVARQSGGAILNMAASFTTDEGGHDVALQPMPTSPDPETLTGEAWSPVFERRYIHEGDGDGRVASWFRMADPIGDDVHAHAAALAYLSDDLPTEAVVCAHPDRPPRSEEGEGTFWSASLDHAIWFHKPPRVDVWHLHDFRCHSLMGSRGLSIGHVFTADGEHLATVTQEVLLRLRR